MESKKNLIVLGNQDHASDLLNFFRYCRKGELFCDVTIKVGLKTYRSHRVVLAMVSDYLKVLMQRHSNEDETINLNNTDIPENVFEQLLDYAYTGKLDINDEDTVLKLAEVSDFLGAVSIKSLCEDYLVGKLTTTNVLQLFTFSYVYNLSTLHSKSKAMFASYYESMSKQKDFLNIPTALLKEFLNDNDLRVCQGENPSLKFEDREKRILNSVCVYVTGNIIKYEEKSRELFELFHFVKLALFDPKTIQKVVSNFKHLKKSDEMQRLIDKANLFRLQESEDVPLFWKSKRRLHHIYEVVQPLATGGHVGYDGYQKFNADESALDPYDKIKNITIWIRRWDGRKVIGAISTISKNDIQNHYGEQNISKLESSHTFALEEDEVIMKINASSGYLVDNLKFTTSHGNVYGPYGGDGGGTRNCNASNKEYFLHSFVGASVKTQRMDGIIELGFRWVRYV